MSILRTLSRMGAALKFAQDPRQTSRMLNGMPQDVRMDIAWPVMPSLGRPRSNGWDGL
ncbi:MULTISPECIES: hypothetical protein [unclassified Mesorhizobium]|uniref:hypothetical protein n=1 Tax=unclassified Mesorhizobium TaxID=325217 RepID=UPI0015E424D6|nr:MULTISPECIES: hypothetical protein [unclassified Mesorhizobium]